MEQLRIRWSWLELGQVHAIGENKSFSYIEPGPRQKPLFRDFAYRDKRVDSAREIIGDTASRGLPRVDAVDHERNRRSRAQARQKCDEQKIDVTAQNQIEGRVPEHRLKRGQSKTDFAVQPAGHVFQ